MKNSSRGGVIVILLALTSVFLAVIAYLTPNVLEPTASIAASAPAMSAATSEPRGSYFPGTEELDANEMRIISCGTGMPAARKSQAATCFLVELGNGDKFLFDVGTGSSGNLAGLNIPYDELDKVFLSHLHSDHIGDLDALWIGGWTGGRHGALHVWGPSGAEQKYGTRYALEQLQKAYSWDHDGRLGVIPTGGGKMEVHEFNYKQMNEIVYQENGVTIRSWPAIHALDGPVSYSLEWSGLKFVFGGDTFPNKWYLEYAKNADLAIHECFMTPDQLMDKYNFGPRAALLVATAVHTPPIAFGKVMSEVKPRMAVAYHFFNDFDVRYPIEAGVRKTYDGPLTMARDLLVWNIKKDQPITVREVVITENAWPAPSATPPDKPNPKDRIPETDFLMSGKVIFHGVEDPLLDKFKKDHGLK